MLHRLSDDLVAGISQLQIMEVCGTHTMSIARNALRSLLPEPVKLISGPGCPVCVTDQTYIDQAVLLAGTGAESGPAIATYGDMVRVPGRHGSLADARSKGATIKVVYSTDQAVDLAKQLAPREVVFLGVGFETTTPGTALAVLRAREEKVRNFSVLVAHKLIMPALRAVLAMPDVRVDAFLCPGHVTVILGYTVYDEIVRDYARPCVAAGFDPGQIMAGVEEILRQTREHKPAACSVYPAASREGNPTAWKIVNDVFEPCDAPWRAIGVIPKSGMALRKEFAEFDAATRFSLPPTESYEMPGCRCGMVISGRLNPKQCPLFAKVCTPRQPVGPCMVSSEGACAAAYKYER